MNPRPVVAVVIPCYRVKDRICEVIKRIGPEVDKVFVVDDSCPEGSGDFVSKTISDSRVKVIKNPKNLGVGGATISGFKAAVADSADIIVKLDGDGQMDPALIPIFVRPIAEGRADYIKGNRFFNLEALNSMPFIRLFGNSVLSFVNKLVSGYWALMDPTNGYFAIHANLVMVIPLEKLSNRYFFESDLLFRLYTIRAVVREVPMSPVYNGEKSSLRIGLVALEFPFLYLIRFLKRIFYCYFLRDFNLCSVYLAIGGILSLSGSLFGVYHWFKSFVYGELATAGTVMLAVLPLIIGIQLLVAALGFDVSNSPKEPIHDSLEALRRTKPSL